MSRAISHPIFSSLSENHILALLVNIYSRKWFASFWFHIMIKFLYFTSSFKVKDGVGFHNIFHPTELVCLRTLYFLLVFFILPLYSVVNCNSVCSSNSLSAGEPLRKNQCFFLCCWVSGQVKDIVPPPPFFFVFFFFFLIFFYIKKIYFIFK